MNKKFKYGDGYAHLLTKLSRIMRLTILIFVLGINSLLAASSYSQMTRITIKAEDTRVEDILNQIENKSEFFFLFNQKLIDLNRKVSIDAKEEKISDILDELFAGTDVKHQVIDRQIILITGEVADSQQINGRITGKVTDRTGAPLPGASVVVKGTTTGVITDNNGNFSLSLPADAKSIVFSFVGMKTQEVNVAGKTSINIIMEEETVGLEEVVAIGYGTQKKASLTAAISTMKTNDIATIPTSNLTNVLGGRLAGTYVQTTTGLPGISSNIRVRAASTWNGGDAIFVIDGVVRDKVSFDLLDPNEIEQLTVLKDAASAAIYGSRSSNGVILVTTKTGKEGKPQVSYSSVFGTDRIGIMPKYLDVPTSIQLNRYVFGVNSITQDEVTEYMKFNSDGMAWFNEAYETPLTQKHQISVSGGTEKVTYYLGGSFYDEKGFLPNVWYKKLNLRSNVSVKLTKDLTVGMNISTNSGTRNRFRYTWGGSDWLPPSMELLYQFSYTKPYIDGKPVAIPNGGTNIIAIMREGGYWRNTNRQIDALVTVEYKLPFVPGLSVKASYSRDFNNIFLKSFGKSFQCYNYATIGGNGVVDPSKPLGTTSTFNGGTGEFIGNEFTKDDTYQLNGQVSYDRVFGKDHHVSAAFIYEQYELGTNRFTMYRNTFPLFAKDQFFAASQDQKNISASGKEVEDGRLSYVGRLNYEYADKYLFAASFREDGSVKFAPGKRWGFFPSLSAGWIVSNENFFKDNNISGTIDMLKLRASFGMTGNDAIGGWGWQDTYNVSGSYFLGTSGTVMPGLVYGGIPNPDITWEKSKSYNIGLDADFLRHFNLSADIWFKQTYDILGPRILALPVEFGGSMPNVNYGEVNSKGFELELGYRNKIGQSFSYAIKGNIGLSNNKVMKKDVAANAQWIDDPNGKTLGYIAGYDCTGIYRTQADLNQEPSGFTTFGQAPVLGMLRYKDNNGPNGTPDGKVDSYDRIKLGDYGLSQAPVSFGLNIDLEYKGFTVSMLFSGLAGFKKFYEDAFSRNIGGYIRFTKWWDDYWTETNVNGSKPKPFAWGDSRATYAENERNSSFNLYNGSFLKMRYLNIGYNLPLAWAKKIGFKSAQVFASGTNLFTWSKFKYYDPEVDNFMSYPLQNTYSIGLNVNF